MSKKVPSEVEAGSRNQSQCLPLGTNICSACNCTKHSRAGHWSLTFKYVKPTEENHLRGAVTKELTVQRRRGGSNDVPNRSHYQREPTCVLHRHTEHFGHKCSLRGSKIVFSNSPKSQMLEITLLHFIPI